MQLFTIIVDSPKSLEIENIKNAIWHLTEDQGMKLTITEIVGAKGATTLSHQINVTE